MRLPRVQIPAQSKDTVENFYGYNHRLKIRRGEMYDTLNLSTRDFPMLATRKRRGMVRRLQKPQGLLAKDKLCWVDSGTLYYGGEATPITGLRDGHKQMVSMGAYVIIFPDKVYYNTQDPTDYGSMEFSRTLTGDVSYALCTVTGTDLSYTRSDTAPSDPENGSYWYDTSKKSLKQWSEVRAEWVTVATVFTRITFEGLGFQLTDFLKEHDGVEIRGTAYPKELDGTKAIYAVGADYIVVVGLIDTEEAQPGAGSIVLSREVPKLDYVCESQNRLWGCYYGKGKDGKMLNEIYCCALGDFKNWRVYMGLSTDSWTASVGSDGPWTGAVSYLGYPTFFKEDTSHRVTISPTGAHSIIASPERGVQQGSWRSLAVVNEILLYKASSDVVAFQGGFPQAVSEALGDEMYADAVGGAVGSSYYLSMHDRDGQWKLFCYDLTNKLWIREDDLQILDMARLGDSLYALGADGVLWDLAGLDGEQETRLPWMAQTGVLYEYQNKQYTSRYDIMLSAPKGTAAEIYIQYDSDGIWRYSGKIRFSGLGAVTVPVRPRRCNHMELRLLGEGEVKIYSISRILEQGSDV